VIEAARVARVARRVDDDRAKKRSGNCRDYAFARGHAVVVGARARARGGGDDGVAGIYIYGGIFVERRSCGVLRAY